MHTCSPTIPPIPTDPLDLRTLCHRVGYSGGGPESQGRYRRLARLLESEPVQIDSQPLPLHACIDGTQAVGLLVRRAHRDVLLAHLAVGAVDPATHKLLLLEERLFGVCSYLDVPELQAVCPQLPLAELCQHHPWELPLASADLIGEARKALERSILDRCPAKAESFIMLDGALPADGIRVDAFGAVKSATDTDWITDPALIPELGGWRSPALLLSAAGSNDRDRLTALVRLRTAGPAAPWTFSLVRVETPAEAGIAMLNAAAARVVAEAPPLGSGDPRGEVQARSMYRTEQVLKARRPNFFDF